MDGSWLPDEAMVKAWRSYNTTGKPADTTTPPAPTDVRLAADGALTWNAVADFESGLAGFIIERDGREIARLPEKPLGKIGTPLWQGLSGGDTPITAQPAMRFVDPAAQADAKHGYRVMSLNSVGLRSPARAATE